MGELPDTVADNLIDENPKIFEYEDLGSNGKYAEVIAEQKLLAVVHRDAYTGETTLTDFTWLEE